MLEIRSRKLTRKSDVYSFGVVLLEVMCGRPAVDTNLDEEQWGLASWAQDRIKEGKVGQIVDSRLKGQISSNCLKEFARIACRCLLNHPNQRPTMAEVIAKLEHILSLQERLNSSVTEGKLIDKVWSFFSAKSTLKSNNLLPALTSGSEGEPSGKEGDKVNNAMVTTGTALVDSGHKDAPQLIHFYANSYTFEDLLRADAELMGKTNYWTTYRATLRNGNQILVRRMKKGPFWKEDIVLRKICSLGQLRHKRILAPKAYYYSKDETLYISDYIKNGSIASLLHSSKILGRKTIRWSTRMGIIVGITEGLVYLHTKEEIVHGYLTSRNVLLDENYNPLFADVGLSQLTEDAKPNSPLNHAPELVKFEDDNVKTDVYSLGLIMLELLTRKSTDHKRNGINLPYWVMSIPWEESRAEVFDPELKREKSNINQELIQTLELAMACVSPSPYARPEAQEVLQRLDEICGYR